MENEVESIDYLLNHPEGVYQLISAHIYEYGHPQESIVLLPKAVLRCDADNGLPETDDEFNDMIKNRAASDGKLISVSCWYSHVEQTRKLTPTYVVTPDGHIISNFFKVCRIPIYD